MTRFPFAVVATMLAFSATVNAQGPKPGTTGAAKAHIQAPKTAAKGAIKSSSSGQSVSHKPATSGSTEHGKSAKSTSTSTSTTAAADAPVANAVSAQIKLNPKQLARVMDFLEPLGLTLEDGTAGFRNKGQFMAAMNASQNRHLDFVALQEAMTVDGLSLGQAAKKVANTPAAPETPEGDTGTTGGTGTGSTGTGSTDTGSTGTGSTGTGSTGTGSTGTTSLRAR